MLLAGSRAAAFLFLTLTLAGQFGCRGSSDGRAQADAGVRTAADRGTLCLEQADGCVLCVGEGEGAAFLDPEATRTQVCDPGQPDNCAEFCSALTPACALPWSQEPGCVFETELAFRRALFLRDSSGHAESPVTGRVVDEGGKRIEGARVRVWLRDGAQLTPIADEVSGRDGLFRVRLRTGPWSYGLRVSYPGLASELLQRISGDRLERLAQRTFRLRPEQALRGKVIDEATGAPVAQAVVEALRAPEDAIEAGEATTDDQGNFTLGGLEARRYHLRASRFGWRPSFTRAQPGEFSKPVLKMVRSSVIQGVVKDAQGRPAADAVVAAVLSGTPGSPTVPIVWTTDRGGVFAQDHFTPGTYYLWARRGDLLAYPPEKLELSETGAMEVTLTLSHRGARVRGSVVAHKGTVLPPGARAHLLSRSSLAFPRPVVSEVDAQGRFELVGVLPGRYEIAIHPGRRDRGPLAIVEGPRHVEVPVEPDMTVDLPAPLVVRPSVIGE